MRSKMGNREVAGQSKARWEDQQERVSNQSGGPQRQTGHDGVKSAYGSPVAIKLGKAPKIVKREQIEDQRVLTVVPLRAAKDRGLRPMELRALLVLGSYSNKGGLTWVGTKRVGEDLSVGQRRAAYLLKALVDKGYVRIISFGYRKIRAHTRQIVFREDISADEAATISGELAPYQLHKQEMEIMEKMKQPKRRGRPPIDKCNQAAIPDSVPLSKSRDVNRELVEIGSLSDHSFAGVEPALLAMAVEMAADRLGISKDQLTLDQISAQLRRLLE